MRRRLRETRQRLGLTYKNIAERSYMSWATYRDLETGRTQSVNQKIDHVAAVTQVFKERRDELIAQKQNEIEHIQREMQKEIGRIEREINELERINLSANIFQIGE